MRQVARPIAAQQAARALSAAAPGQHVHVKTVPRTEQARQQIKIARGQQHTHINTGDKAET